MLAGARQYYRAALSTLRFIEAQAPTKRRFGADADALWRSFRGHLDAHDRIDLLLRDADAQWPEAFGARGVFALRAVAEDDPFGSEWASLNAVEGNDLWRSIDREEAPASVALALERAAAAWEISLAAHDVEEIGAAEKVVVCGPSAIVATVLAFEGKSGLDWSDQVVVVATPPGHRQLAGLGAALLKIAKPSTIVSRDVEGSADVSLAGRRAVVSEDADVDDAQLVRERARG